MPSCFIGSFFSGYFTVVVLSLCWEASRKSIRAPKFKQHF